MSNIASLLSDCTNGVNKIKSWFDWLGTSRLFKAFLGPVASSVFFGLSYWAFNQALSALNGTRALVDGLGAARNNVDPLILEKVNYIFPLDTLATVVLLYFSIWVGVQAVRLWLKFFDLGTKVIEAVPFVE